MFHSNFALDVASDPISDMITAYGGIFLAVAILVAGVLMLSAAVLIGVAIYRVTKKNKKRSEEKE